MRDEQRSFFQGGSVGARARGDLNRNEYERAGFTRLKTCFSLPPQLIKIGYFYPGWRGRREEPRVSKTPRGD